ncbi:uncharacterized protein TNIN_495071 [Trichonephila inaurata madagascariensis]|uniref:Gustatory receptor n=1 Tax=Trichonephila inaurata madagascariensis TaxID=2747483 RepID=A0A8X7BNS4_9ARAC|nr:uncharacterized protein TNIN_495071 [Trichonephila inaurata madagascariensis]
MTKEISIAQRMNKKRKQLYFENKTRRHEGNQSPLSTRTAIGIPNSNSKNAKLSSFPFTLLHWIGLVQESTKIGKCIFPFVLLMGITDLSVTSIMRFKTLKMRVHLASIFSMICSLIIWCTIRRKAKHLSWLLLKLNGTCFPINENRWKFITFLILCLPFALTAGFLLNPNITEILVFHSCGIEFKSYTLLTLIVVVKKFLHFLAYPTFPCMIVFLYCILCRHCSTCLCNLTGKVNKCSPESFGPSEQMVVLREKIKIDDFLENIQDIFSVPSFFIIFSSFLSCSSVLGCRLVSGWNTYSVILNMTRLCYGLFGFFCVAAVFWTAGELPIQLHNLKEAFYKKAHLRFVFIDCSEESLCKRELLDKPEFVLNGCDVLSYKRSSLIAFVGAMLTYTVLAVEINDRSI